MQPLLVLFEDLHWIDAETQALLDSLVESLPTVRILLLTSYRPEYQHTWSRKTYYRQLNIDPLLPESAEEMLKSLLGHDPGLQPLERLLIECDLLPENCTTGTVSIGLRMPAGRAPRCVGNGSRKSRSSGS